MYKCLEFPRFIMDLMCPSLIYLTDPSQGIQGSVSVPSAGMAFCTQAHQAYFKAGAEIGSPHVTLYVHISTQSPKAALAQPLPANEAEGREVTKSRDLSTPVGNGPWGDPPPLRGGCCTSSQTLVLIFPHEWNATMLLRPCAGRFCPAE